MEGYIWQPGMRVERIRWLWTWQLALLVNWLQTTLCPGDTELGGSTMPSASHLPKLYCCVCVYVWKWMHVWATWCLLAVSHLSFFQGQDGRKAEEVFVICERTSKLPPSGNSVRWAGGGAVVDGASLSSNNSSSFFQSGQTRFSARPFVKRCHFCAELKLCLQLNAFTNTLESCHDIDNLAFDHMSFDTNWHWYQKQNQLFI